MKTFVDQEHYLGNQLLNTLQATADEDNMLQIIERLKPEFSKDGNQYCYLYGTLPNDCVVGFGNTAYDAMVDFCRNFKSHPAFRPQKSTL